MQRYLPVNEDAAPDYPGADQDGPDEARAPIPSRPTTGWSYTGGHAAPPRAPPRKKKIRSDRGGRRGAGNGTEFLSREGGGRDRLVDEQRPVNRTENGRRTTKPEPLAEKRTIGEEPSERRGLHHKEDLPGGGGRVHGSRSGAGFGDEAHFNSDRNLPNHKNHYQANGKPSDKGSAARGTKTTSSVVEKARSESVLSCERYPRVAVSQSDGGYTGLSPRGYGAERGVEDDDQWDRVRPNERDLRTKRGPKAQVSTSADTSPLQSRLAQSMPSAVSGPADDREFSDGMDTFYVPAVGDADVERGGAAAHTREDLADLEFLDNDVLLSELERRFNEGQPYTYIGDSLVAVNPCKRLNIYTVECHTKYHDLGVRSKEAAHVFWVAAQVHRNLVLTATNQCVVLAGDSGAGKTESAKYILTHLVRCGSGRKSVSWFQTDRAPLTCDIVGRLEKVNLLLEQFGNASTVLNDNSSRFGKLLELGYDEYGVLITAHLECFILEKFRVTSRHPREKNFHIFYALFAGLSPARKAELGLDVEPETFRILAPCEPSDGGVFESEKKKAGYRQEELNSMLHHVGFTPQEISDLFKVLGAILHLSAIEFQIDADSFDDSVEITSAGKVYLGKALDVLGIGSAKVSTEFEKCLLELTIEVKGDKLGKPKTLRQAREGRDALVRELYSRLFYGIVEQINHNLRNDQTQQSTVNSQQSSVRPSSSELCIRLLDISGFENVVELNSFEQFIINSTSERLHQFFLHHTFRTELQEYIDEGVPEVTVKFVDNAQIVGLIFSVGIRECLV